MKKIIFVLFGLAFMSFGCERELNTTTPVVSIDGNVDTDIENTFVFDSSAIEGMGEWNWKGYSTISSGSAIYRQIDNPFGFSYPATWELSETLDGVSVFTDGFKIDFLPADVKNSRIVYSELKDYCPSWVTNGSDYVPVSEGVMTVGGKDAYYIKYDSTSGKEYSRYRVCVDLGLEFFNVIARPLDESFLLIFENMLGSLTFGLDPRETPELWAVYSADADGLEYATVKMWSDSSAPNGYQLEVSPDKVRVPAEDFRDATFELIPAITEGSGFGDIAPDMITFDDYVDARMRCSQNMIFCPYYGIAGGWDFFEVYSINGIDRMVQKYLP